MSRARRATTAALVLLAASAAGAQPGTPPPPDPAALRGDSTQTRKRLAEAEQKVLGGKAADAADELQRLLDESGDDLITLDGKQYRTARWVAHAILARLPADALRAYQDRIDQPAKKLLDLAKRTRDPRPLWQLLDRYFVSRPGDEALLLLGDLLFERGEFRAAEDVWRRLLPDSGADPVYPGSKADPALVRARVALAIIFQGDAARARAAVAAFQQQHPTAGGTLAGRTGPLADTLQAFLAAAPKLAPDATGGSSWPTYGGGPDRAGRVPGGIPRAYPARPTWSKPLTTEDRAPPARAPFGHPVVIDGEVFVSDGLRVFGFDLSTGEPTGTYRPQEPLNPGAAPVRLREPLNLPDGARFLDPAFTLTAAGGLLYARLGASAVRPPDAVGGRLLRESALVCLDSKLNERWRLFPPEEDKVPAAWEGAPLVAGRRLWAAYAKFEGGRVVHVVACYDPADADRAPARPAWTAEVCDSAVPVAGGERNRQELLTLAGRHVVFCSNNGAVVAVDAVTGRRSWGFRYPRTRRAPPGGTTDRLAPAAASDPAPAVAFGGRVYVAPADGERVYALDAETGRLVWESGPTEGARVLGVSRGRLVVTVAGPLRGVRALNLDTGSYRSDGGGWVQGERHMPLSYGQGLVTDDRIVWPTREGLWFLDAETGLPEDDPRYGSVRDPIRIGKVAVRDTDRNYFGHFAYADGVLVVVTATHVSGYVPQSMRIEPRPDATPRERFDLLTDRAEAEAAAGKPADARATLAQIVASDWPPALRARAAARMLQLAPPATEAARLPPEVRGALRAPLLAEWVIAPDGVPVTLEHLLARHLGQSPAPGSLPAAVPAAATCPHGLTAESDIDRTVRLPEAVAPLALIPGCECAPKRLFAGGPRVIVALPLDRGAAAEFAAADLFTHAAEVRNWVVAAGPRAVAVYGAVREPLWVFRVPATDPLPGPARARAPSAGERSAPHLSSFVLAGPWLLARVGEHHLVALDLPARRVAWVLNTGGRGAYEPAQFAGAVRFGPHLAVCGRFAVAQLSDGRRWFVELTTGRPVVLPALGEHTAHAWWPHGPLDAGANRLLVSDGPGLLRLLQVGGRVRWAFEVDRDEGLVGEPLRMCVRGDVLLVAARRNHGVEIERVSLGTGKALWTGGPVFADADRVELAHADADADHAYVPAANKLVAVTLAKGEIVWEAELPDARGPRGWVVRAGKSCVLVYPAEAIPAEPPGEVIGRLARSFGREPLVWRLPGLAATLYDAWVAREVPVLLLDPETGKQLSRFDVPARGPAVAAYLGADRAVIATGDRVVWLK